MMDCSRNPSAVAGRVTKRGSDIKVYMIKRSRGELWVMCYNKKIRIQQLKGSGVVKPERYGRFCGPRGVPRGPQGVIGVFRGGPGWSLGGPSGLGDPPGGPFRSKGPFRGPRQICFSSLKTFKNVKNHKHDENHVETGSQP